ncbi:MAG: DUF2334 domain-containing protein [Pseudomonas sp.]|uniref:DUF2334 domain-containing protein n=1 Tax=Pseudomonas sp. TaxID=306 RepID=UPI003397B4F8
MGEQSVSLVLHDASPLSWAAYRSFVEAVDAFGHVPITWLVVPDFHHRQPLAAHPGFCRYLDVRLARGDEVVLHGLYHCDEGPPPASLSQWFMRRVYTREGEFHGLDQTAALARLQTGIELFRRLGWPLQGFVAPAWLMSAGTRQALAHCGLVYTSDRQRLYRLPGFSPVAAPSLVWSARSGWRRGASWLLSEAAWRHYRSASLLRLGVHPVDLRHAVARDYWLRLLRQALHAGRVAQTKQAWLACQGS